MRKRREWMSFPAHRIVKKYVRSGFGGKDSVKDSPAGHIGVQPPHKRRHLARRETVRVVFHVQSCHFSERQIVLKSAVSLSKRLFRQADEKFAALGRRISWFGWRKASERGLPSGRNRDRRSLRLCQGAKNRESSQKMEGYPGERRVSARESNCLSYGTGV